MSRDCPCAIVVADMVVMMLGVNSTRSSLGPGTLSGTPMVAQTDGRSCIGLTGLCSTGLLVFASRVGVEANFRKEHSSENVAQMTKGYSEQSDGNRVSSTGEV